MAAAVVVAKTDTTEVMSGFYTYIGIHQTSNRECNFFYGQYRECSFAL